MGSRWERWTPEGWVPHTFPLKKTWSCRLGFHDVMADVFRIGGRDNDHFRCPACGAPGGSALG